MLGNVRPPGGSAADPRYIGTLSALAMVRRPWLANPGSTPVGTENLCAGCPSCRIRSERTEDPVAL